MRKLNKECRRLEEDIWGKILGKERYSKVGKYFKEIKENRGGLKGSSFRVDVVKIRRKQKRLSFYGKMVLNRKKICLYYGGLQKYEYRELCRKAEKIEKEFGESLVGLLESRLYVVVHRMGYSNTIFEAKGMVKEGKIMVNKKVIENIKYEVKSGDIVEVVEEEKGGVYKKIEKREGYWFLQENIEVNHNILAGMYLRDPKIAEVLWPNMNMVKEVEGKENEEEKEEEEEEREEIESKEEEKGIKEGEEEKKEEEEEEKKYKEWPNYISNDYFYREYKGKIR